jgi:molybdate transport system substrate-binding protein
VPLAACALSVVAACGTSGSAHQPYRLHGSITVFAAASLTGSFTELGRQFEAAHPGTTVKLSFGASSTLAQQIDQGAPADVFASAAPANMQQVMGSGAVASSSDFAANTAEIAVAPSKASTVTGLADLGRPGVRVALCQVQVPCGALAESVLANAGVTVKPVTQGLDVKSTLAYVTNGQVDAAVVYVTDVRAAGSSVVGVPIPDRDNAKTEYPIGVVTSSRNAALATVFDLYVESPAGRSVLAAAGFSAP